MRTIALVHGWGFGSAIWQPVKTGLSRLGTLRVYTWPGYRVGDAPVGDTLQGMADTLVEHTQDTDVCIAWSLGGLAALQAVSQQGRVWEHLILVGTTPRFVTGPGWDKAVTPAVLEEFISLTAEDPEAVLMRFALLQGPRLSGDRGAAREMIARVTGPSRPDRFTLLAGLEVLRTGDVRAQLDQIDQTDQPVGLIHGQRDQLVPIEAGRYLKRQLPTATLTEIPGSGHAPFWSHSTDFVAAVSQCIEQA